MVSKESYITIKRDCVCDYCGAVTSTSDRWYYLKDIDDSWLCPDCLSMIVYRWYYEKGCIEHGD